MDMTERQKRYEVASHFIATLSPMPITWHIEGSTERGDFRADSDIDVHALWERKIDEPMLVPDPLVKSTITFEGYEIDLHTFAKDWAVFKANPKLLLVRFPQLRENTAKPKLGANHS